LQWDAYRAWVPYRYTIILGHGIREDESTTFGQAVLGKAVLDRRIRLIPAVFAG